MKKSITILGSISIVLLMFSTATAMPQLQTEKAIPSINRVKENKALIEEEIINSQDLPPWLDQIIRTMYLIFCFVWGTIYYLLTGERIYFP